MTGPSLAVVLLIMGTVMLVMSLWRQIAALLLFIVLTVFCFGVYYIVSTIRYIT